MPEGPPLPGSTPSTTASSGPASPGPASPEPTSPGPTSSGPASSEPASSQPGSLAGRVALVTGVSRDAGIGAAVVRALHAGGATVVASGWPPHDDAMPWSGGNPADLPVGVERHDLADPAGPAALVDAVVARHGALDVIVAAHARSSDHDLAGTTAAELDATWAVNVRSIVLLAQRLAAVHDPTRPGGRLVWFTSGQHLGPLPDELPYEVSKAALHGMTATIAAAVAPAGIAAMCVNPGPVDTGWAPPHLHAEVAARFPSGRWTSPADTAAVIAFLVSDAGAALAGQVVDAEFGFRR